MHPFYFIKRPFSEGAHILSLIHISEPTRRTPISYAVFCLKKTPSVYQVGKIKAKRPFWRPSRSVTQISLPDLESAQKVSLEKRKNKNKGSSQVSNPGSPALQADALTIAPRHLLRDWVTFLLYKKRSRTIDMSVSFEWVGGFQRFLHILNQQSKANITIDLAVWFLEIWKLLFLLLCQLQDYC